MSPLEHIRDAIRECERVHSDEEVREAAQALGVEHWLPDPQRELELRSAA